MSRPCLHSSFVFAVLQELPDALCGLQLVLLDLTNNSLRRLPPALGNMTSLRSMPLVRQRADLFRLHALTHMQDYMQAPNDCTVS